MDGWKKYDADHVKACTGLVVEGEGACRQVEEDLAEHAVRRHASAES